MAHIITTTSSVCPASAAELAPVLDNAAELRALATAVCVQDLKSLDASESLEIGGLWRYRRSAVVAVRRSFAIVEGKPACAAPAPMWPIKPANDQHAPREA